MYFGLLLAVTLGAGLILHGMASVLSLAAWHGTRGNLDRLSPRVAARLLLSLRMFPAAASLIVLAVFVVPAFVEYEPRTTLEPLSLTLLSLAGVTAIILSGSVFRSVSAWLQSRRVMRQWMRGSHSTHTAVEGVTVNHCQVDSPVIAVLGMWPTRIFTSQKVFEALTAAELDAALRHEAVHVRNFDVFKKMLLQLAPSFLPGIDLLKGVSAHWSRMCELAADEESVAADANKTLHLASALVKVARLASPTVDPRVNGRLPTLSASLHAADSLLGYRVQRLLQISERPSIVAVNGFDFNARKLLLAGGFTAALLLAAYPQALSFTHELLEFLVRG